MKIKIDETLKGVDGVETLKGEKGCSLTLKDICINSLLTPIQEEEEKTKWEKYEIFKKFRDAKGEVELKVEEITITKKAIGRIQPQLIMGQCYEFLENNLTIKKGGST